MRKGKRGQACKHANTGIISYIDDKRNNLKTVRRQEKARQEQEKGSLLLLYFFYSKIIDPKLSTFREGNGRVARILSTLMALQAGLPLLDFGLITVERKKEYFAAIQAGLDKNYRQMENLFSVIIERSDVEV